MIIPEPEYPKWVWRNKNGEYVGSFKAEWDAPSYRDLGPGKDPRYIRADLTFPEHPDGGDDEIPDCLPGCHQWERARYFTSHWTGEIEIITECKVCYAPYDEGA